MKVNKKIINRLLAMLTVMSLVALVALTGCKKDSASDDLFAPDGSGGGGGGATFSNAGTGTGYGIFSETHTSNGLYIDAPNAALDAWSGTITLATVSTGTAEGLEAMEVTTTAAAGWFGGGWRADGTAGTEGPLDISALSGSNLIFEVKSADQDNFSVGMEGGTTGYQKVAIGTYGYTPDDAWHTITIPLSVFTGLGVPLTNVKGMFYFSSDGGTHVAGNKIYLDNIRIQ